MKFRSALFLLVLVVDTLFLSSAALAQAQGADTAKPPPDLWPRVIDLSNVQVLMYQPQINQWIDNQNDLRAALAIKPVGAKQEAFGTIVAHNARTGQTNTWNTASVGNNHYAEVNGNVYSKTDKVWQQHSASGWSGASGDTSWADRESQARSAGDDRSGGFSSFGGGGGFGGGDRFGGGGFGGSFGGGFRGGGFSR